MTAPTIGSLILQDFDFPRNFSIRSPRFPAIDSPDARKTCTVSGRLSIV